MSATLAAVATDLSALLGRSEYKYEDAGKSENEDENEDVEEKEEGEGEERVKAVREDGLKFHCRMDVGGMTEARVMTTVLEMASSPPTIMMSLSFSWET